MSLLRPIIRQCAVAALRDKTWADSRVYDSDMTPFAEAVAGLAAQPYVVVYTDSDDRTLMGLPEMYDGDYRTLSLVIEMGVASAIKDTEKSNAVIRFAATDEGMEFAVDVLETQVVAALLGDPLSPWGNLLKQICFRLKKVPSRRGGQAQGGIRLAARRTVFQFSTIDDIPPGVVPGPEHPVSKFIAMAEASDPALGIQDTGQLIADLMSASAAPTWRQAQAYLGMSTEAVKMLGPDGTPLPWPTVEEPPLDFSDANEFVPGTTKISTPRDS